MRALEAKRQSFAASAVEEDAVPEELGALVAECNALRRELDRLRQESAREVERLRKQLAVAEREREGMEVQLKALAAVCEERDRLRKWIAEIEQELCSAQGWVRELESRAEALSRLNARLSVERAELKGRLEALTEERALSDSEHVRPTRAMEVHLAELEAELARLTAAHALHRGANEEVRTLRAELEGAYIRQQELQQELTRLRADLAAREDAAADAATQVELLRELVERGAGMCSGPPARTMVTSERVQELESALQRVRSELAAARAEAAEEIAKLKDSLQQAERLAAGAAAARDRHTAAIARLLAERSEIRSENAALRRELSASAETRTILERRVAVLEETLDDLRRAQQGALAELEALCKTAQMTDVDRADLRLRLERMAAAYAAETARLTERIRDVKAR